MVRGWNDPGSRISVRFADSAEQRELRVRVYVSISATLYVYIFSVLNDRVAGTTLHLPALQWRRQLCSTCEGSKCKVASEYRSIPPIILSSVASCPLSPRSASMTFPAYITINKASFLLTPLYPWRGPKMAL